MVMAGWINMNFDDPQNHHGEKAKEKLALASFPIRDSMRVQFQQGHCRVLPYGFCSAKKNKATSRCVLQFTARW